MWYVEHHCPAVRIPKGPPMRTAKAVLPLAPAVLLVTAAVIHAGPLDPPAGPVASTGKTILEVEPRTIINATNTPGDANSVFRITQPGSYYLTANVLGEANKRGIEITASHVTIDLNGFTVHGQSIVSTLDGIANEGASVAIVVRNGHITGWGAHGVSFSLGGSAAGNRIEGVVARSNVGNGISPGDSAAVIGCTAISNGGAGITVSSSATILECVARSNGGTGIATGSGCTIEDCTARLNGGTGIQVGLGSVARGCAAFDNLDGFSVVGGIVQACTASENNEDGFVVSSSSSAMDCVAQDNGINGFTATSAATITGCRSNSNITHGFSFGTGCVIKDNVAYANGTGGIGAGFVTAGTDSRIEGNYARQGDYGFWITGSRNVIIRNSVAGATTSVYEIAANNIYGPIVDRSAIATASVSGSSAASTMGTTDPHANVTH